MNIHNVGGTPGGLKTFLVGIIMVVVGGYLLLDHVQVHGGYWHSNWFGSGYGTSFGVTLIPLLFGIGLLFANGKSIAGKVLTAGGALVILTGIIANLELHFRRTSLWNVLTMLILIVGGIGLVVRSVMPMEPRARNQPD